MNARVTSLSLENVRCFSGEQRVTCPRITLLVGENSAGKSTFLGCLNGLVHLANLNELDDRANYFNHQPFFMDNFKNIVRSGCRSFSVGLGFENTSINRLKIEFEAGVGNLLREKALEIDMTNSLPKVDAALRISRKTQRDNIEHWCFESPGFEFKLNQSDVSYTQFTTWLSRSVRFESLPFSGEPTQFRKRMGHVTDKELVAFSKFTNFFRHHFRAPEALILNNAVDPQGARPSRFYTSYPLGVRSRGEDLHILNTIGQHLGLFSQIDIRKSIPNRYEILVDVSGELRNIVDVGYGVSSLLPLINDFADSPDGTLFLLQQPEVHIHPSAQAKLVELFAKSKYNFVIETHSDHIIDWFRILVTEGQLAASDVGIIYFERLAKDKSATQLHQLSFDGSGNLRGQPQNYRQFFSEETARLLGLQS